MSNLTTLFGKKIKAIRMKQGFSQEELAFRTKLHRTYISDVERGTRNVSLINIEKISEALGVTLSNLFNF